MLNFINIEILFSIFRDGDGNTHIHTHCTGEKPLEPEEAQWLLSFSSQPLQQSIISETSQLSQILRRLFVY